MEPNQRDVPNGSHLRHEPGHHVRDGDAHDPVTIRNDAEGRPTSTPNATLRHMRLPRRAAPRGRPGSRHAPPRGGVVPVYLRCPPIEALRQALLARGYTEGRSLTFEFRWAEGHFDRFPALVAELVASRVDVIFASGG